MAAVSTHILRSMRMIGEKSRGDTLTSAEQTECLAEFNTFLDACANERLLGYTVVEDTKALTASTESYTIGTNGDIATTRPVKLIDPCFIRDSSGYDTPVEIIDYETYGLLVDKDSGFTVPAYIYYDGGYSATSTATLYLYPSPSAGLTLHVNSWKQLGSFSTMTHPVNLPPGYQLFIESNFAIHLAAGQTPISPELAKIARESKAAIKSLNIPDTVMSLDAGIAYRRTRSILTG